MAACSGMAAPVTLAGNQMQQWSGTADRCHHFTFWQTLYDRHHFFSCLTPLWSTKKMTSSLLLAEGTRTEMVAGAKPKSKPERKGGTVVQRPRTPGSERGGEDSQVCCLCCDSPDQLPHPSFFNVPEPGGVFTTVICWATSR